MLYYANEEYLRKTIMEQSRHQFIYSYNDDRRKQFLQKLESEYPIVMNCNAPMCIYLNEFGLPKIPIEFDELDNTRINTISREYLSFTIAHSILEKSKNNVDKDLLNSRLRKLLDLINKYNLNDDCKEITSIDELISAFEQSKLFYMSYYLEYFKNGNTTMSISDLPIPFLQLESFVSQYKRALNNKSHFGIVLDKQEDISTESTRAVNSFVASRINKDISIKAVVEPGNWETYISDNGQYIEAVHDYGIIELDDSQSEYVKRLKKI